MEQIDIIRGLAIAECLKNMDDAQIDYSVAREEYMLLTSPIGKDMIQSIVDDTIETSDTCIPAFELN